MLIDILIQTGVGLFLFQVFLLLTPPIVVKVGPNNWLLKRRGATAVNNPLGVLIDKNQDHYHAVLAQELYECEQRKNLFYLVKTLVSDSESRTLEATGQLITVFMMCDMDRSLNFDTVRHRRAEFISRKYKQFEFYSAGDVLAIMDKNHYEARKWADWYIEERGHTML
jgi:hypothetical protein